MKREYYVYMTTHHREDNIKYYIGQHYGLIDDDYYGSGKHLRNAINKYPEAKLSKEILEVCDSRESLDEAEVRWIAKYNADLDGSFYNVAKGGSNIIAMRGPNNPWYGKLPPCYDKDMSIEYLSRAWHNPSVQKRRIETLKSRPDFRDNCRRAQILRYKDPSQRKLTSISTKNALKNPGIRAKKSESMKRLWDTPGYRELRGLNITGEKNPFYSKHHTDAFRKYKSESQLGDLNHFYGKHHTDESKSKSSSSMKRYLEDHPEEMERRKNCSLGRRCITNGSVNKRVKSEDLNSYLMNGWKLGVTKF